MDLPGISCPGWDYEKSEILATKIFGASVLSKNARLQNQAHICAFFNSPDEAHRLVLPFVNERRELGQKASHTNRERVLWGPHWRQNRCSP
jgi:hypothetical protein